MSIRRDEGTEATPARRVGRPQLTKPIIIDCAALVIAGIALGAYWMLRQGDAGPQVAAPAAVQSAASSQPLTSETASKLLNDILERRPVVIRLALGDVATIDKNGQVLPLYPRLAQGQVVRLRFCRFPGADGPANQICLADLTDNAKQYVYAGDTPIKVISVSMGEVQAKNRSIVQLVVGVPRVAQIIKISDQRRGEKQIAYAGAFELMPIASALGVLPEQLPSSLTGTAEARMGVAGWTIESDGLQQTQAKAQ